MKFYHNVAEITRAIREGKKLQNTRIKKGEMKVGYAIFNRCIKTGRLVAICESSFSMPWSYELACVWNNTANVKNNRYFKPERGDFIVKTTRQYNDLNFLGYSGIKSNFKFEEITNVNIIL